MLNRKKGQLIFEFVIAAVLLFSIVLYIINYLSTNVFAFSNDFYFSNLESKVIQISEVLVYNKDVGLSQDWPTLNYTKIQELNQSCNDSKPNIPDDLATKLDVDSNKIKIQINDTLNTEMLNCGRVPPKGIPRAEIKRYAVSSENNEILILTVVVW